jgi:putative flippase GtrA
MRAGRLLSFGLIGVVNTADYYVCYLFFSGFMPYMGAHVCATAVAMVVSYFLNCYITFRTSPSWRSFVLFPLTNAASIAITSAGLPIAVQWVGLPVKVAPLVVSLAAVPITYLVARYVMNGRRRPDLESPSADADALRAAAHPSP